MNEMQRRLLHIFGGALAFLLLALAIAQIGYGQAEPDKPGVAVGEPGKTLNVEALEAADDPHWWTLTDEITPQELRAIHKDVALHKERYREAVEAGTRDPLPEEQMELLNFFIDGSTHPELFKMRLVFDSFAAGLIFDPVDPRGSLAEFGFEGEALESIVQISSEYWRSREILQEKVGEEMKAVSELVRLSKERLGQKNYNVAIKARDATMLANATGYSVERAEKLLKLWWEQTPAADFSAQTLPVLKETLGPTEWERFRSYLLEVQAPTMSALGYAEVEGN